VTIVVAYPGKHQICYNINADFKYGGRVRTEIVRLGIDINGKHDNETDFLEAA
jgi:hypothetical protein